MLISINFEKLHGQWQIAGIKTLALIDGRARVFGKVEDIDLTF
jgi:hypothetical protein